jgi:UDP-2,3-diacylglucosamine pyrophosphatase LpxH
MKRIIQGHKEFFTGLAEFLAKGNYVVILPGNHDIEFCYEEVQEALRNGLAEFSPGENIKNNLEFRRWFYHEKENVFVEHGHQYDELNSFDYFLCPFFEEDGVKRIILPVGSFFVRYLFNKVEEFHPFADNIKPVTRFIRYMIFELIKRPRKLRQLVPLIGFFIEIVDKVRKLSPKEKEELEVKQQSIMKKISAEEDIPPNKVEEIKSLWVPSSITNYSQYQVLCGLLSPPKTDVHRRSASRIRDALGVKYVVFGHTHDPYLAGLPNDKDRKGEYVNSSTWTKVFVKEESEEGLIREEKEFVFVRILKNEKELRMDLLKWRNELGKPERVLLFKKLSRGRKRE